MFHLSHNTFLRRHPLLEGLSQEEAQELLALCAPFRRVAGERLFSQGDPPDGLYIVERGEVAVYTEPPGNDRVMLAEFGNSAIIGEMGLVTKALRSATVEALTSTDGWWLSRQRFEPLQAAGRTSAYRVILHIARMLEQRRRTTEQRLRTLIDEPDRQARLASRPVRELLGALWKA